MPLLGRKKVFQYKMMRRQARRSPSRSSHGVIDSTESARDELLPLSHSPPKPQQQHAPSSNSESKFAKRRRRAHRRQPFPMQSTIVLAVISLLAVALLVGAVFLLRREGKEQHEQNLPIMDGVLSSKNDERPAFQISTDSAPTCMNGEDDPLDPDDITYTLVTQMSDDRLWMMEHHCSRWGHENQVSIAVLTNETKDDVWKTLIDDLHCSDTQLTLEVVDARNFSYDDYPVNLLRNTALQGVVTSHVLFVDVDFWESTNLAQTLMEPDIRQSLSADPKLALVVPAFQLARQCHDWRDCREANIPKMPKVKLDLLPLLKGRQANQFDPTNAGGHGSTRYKDWFYQLHGELLKINCVKSNRYEPFLVFRYCRELPPFQEAFSGYGKNKMTWIMFLVRLGYELKQVGGAFVVHYPHLDSQSRMKWNEAPPSKAKAAWNLVRKVDGKDEQSLMQFKRAQVDKLFVTFREWLRTTIPDQAKIGKCHDAADDDAKLWIDRGTNMSVSS